MQRQPAAQPPMGVSANATLYSCSECGGKTQLKPKDSIRCSHCSKSMLFKLRDTSAPSQFLCN
ncbi:DNA-directed RNA polymerases I, II, and III subunit RPABC4 [Pancytospora philotis]|nr:DNA-directed RNA polymerases I, II, and III subunit RPABC4 [Pancytospora philotis]